MPSLRPGLQLEAVQGRPVDGVPFDAVIRGIQGAKRPLEMVFRPQPRTQPLSTAVDTWAAATGTTLERAAVAGAPLPEWYTHAQTAPHPTPRVPGGVDLSLGCRW